MKTRICVLEDDNAIRNMISLILTDLGFKVIAFATITELLDHLERSVYEMFILDIQVPDGNGLDICFLLRSNKLYDSVPILMMSADIEASYVKKVFYDVDFIEKPFALEDFISTVLTLIENGNKTHTDNTLPGSALE